MSANRLVRVLNILQKHKLIDEGGHIPNCGYTNENASCGCAALGAEIHSAVTEEK